MKEMHAISITALIYAILYAIVTLIFFPDYIIWAVLGSATALFNHSLMIQSTKGKFNVQRYVFHLFQRYTFYIIIIAFTWLRTKDLPGNTMMYSFIFLLIGILSLKLAVYINMIPGVKKFYNIKEDDDAPVAQ
jgi:hypothetical protein